MRKLTHPEILSLRKQNESKERSPISILLNDVRSLYNVGSIFRIADGIRAEKVYLCGITGAPPDKAITKTALGSEAYVPWEYCRDARVICEKLRSNGTQLIVMEHTDSSVNYLEAKIQFPCCLIVGNEVAGVDSALVELADLAIEIPMNGEKNSLNVAIATAVASYHLLAKQQIRAPAQFP